MWTENKVLKFVVELKQAFFKQHGDIWFEYDQEKYSSVVEMWADNVPDQKFAEIVKFMYINNLPGTNIYLFKYRGYTEIFSQVDPREFWNMYNGLFRECRSITIDVEEEIIVLAAYDKFFNMDELPETLFRNV